MMITITTPRGVTSGSGLRMVGGGATGTISTQRETMGDGSMSSQRSIAGCLSLGRDPGFRYAKPR